MAAKQRTIRPETLKGQGGGERETGRWPDAQAENVFSQFGEDGILQAIFSRLEITRGLCVDVGAWDGRHLSNTANLILNKGWSGILIEADKTRFRELQMSMASQPQVQCVQARIGLTEQTNLEACLRQLTVQAEIDLLCIDIDGNDFHVWSDLQAMRPKVVVIEFNPCIPNRVRFVQKRDKRINQGSSLRSLVELGKSKGYAAVAATFTNLILVDSRFLNALRIEANRVEQLRVKEPYDTVLLQLYDGTLAVAGFEKLVWHGVPIRADAIQVLPTWLRFMPENGRYPWRQRWLARLAKKRALPALAEPFEGPEVVATDQGGDE